MTRMIRYDPVYDMLLPMEPEALAPLSLGTLPVESLGNLPLDVYETDKALVVEASLPGFTQDEIEIEEHQGILTIRAEHRETFEDEGEHWVVKERSVQMYERSIPLPVEVKAEKAEATLEHGILRISFPKVQAEEAKTHRIKVSLPKLKLPKLGKKEAKVKVKKG